MSEPVQPAAVDSPLEAALTRLEPALTGVADALAQLSRAQWAALERQEWGVTFAAHQCWDVIGLPEQQRMIPQFVLGHRIIEIFAARYPQLARDDRAA
jgi:hypothetical protein